MKVKKAVSGGGPGGHGRTAGRAYSKPRHTAKGATWHHGTIIVCACLLRIVVCDRVLPRMRRSTVYCVVQYYYTIRTITVYYDSL